MKLIYILILFFSLKVFPQQDEHYTQYMYNTISINPAYAGSRDVLSCIILHRSQWLGFDNGPKTTSLSMHTPTKNRNLGLGLNILNDSHGNVALTSVDLPISYTIFLKEDLKLSFGVSLGLNSFKQDFSKLDVYDSSDLNFNNENYNSLSFKFGTGVLLKSNHFYLGLSVPKLYNNVRKSIEGEFYLKDNRLHTFLTLGYIYEFNNSVKFLPAAIVKYVDGAPLQTDLSLNISLLDKYILGVSNRINTNLSVLAGFKFNDSWMIGSSYDLYNKIPKYSNNGSFEFFIRYELFRKYDKLMTPRYF
jgi:type IX secretion system PorP/SprF family membrane protein